jgi:aminopeptidase YwaD
MDTSWLTARIAAHVTALAQEIGARPPGSPANTIATDYLRMVLTAAGLPVHEDAFTCRWWEPGSATLEIGGAWYEVTPAPFSAPCDVRGRVTRLSTDADLDAAAIAPGGIVVIDGDLVAESYFPKAFPFMDLPEQRDRLERLEALRPAAVVAVVPELRAMAVFEDGDLAFPYVAVLPPIGDRIRERRAIGVRIGGSLNEGSGVNIATRHGGPGPRILLSAHVDSEATTPGAFDNASGVATLLALAEAGLPDDVPVELVFFNGEDHYQAPGEQAWLASADLDGIRHVINLDGAGVVGHDTTVAMLACPPELEDRVRAFVAALPGWVIGREWYESDHAIFAMRGIPSLAITSANAHELMANVIHTDRDTPRIVDATILARVATFLDDWLRQAG